jgi:hypothetical protein
MAGQVQADLVQLHLVLPTQAEAAAEHIKQALAHYLAEAALLYYVGLRHNNEF